MAPVDHLSIVNRVTVLRDYAALWQRYFTFFQDDLEEKNFTPDEEQEFANIVSLLSLNHFKFQELTKAYFKDAGKVIDVLKETASLEMMKKMPGASFSKIQVEWHTLFIGMNKALGKMLSEMGPKQLEQLKQVQSEQGQQG